MKTPKLTCLLALLLATAFCAPGLNAQDDSSATQKNDAASTAQSEVTTNQSQAEAPETATNAAPASASSDSAPSEQWGNPVVAVGSDVELKAGDSAESVVAVFGSAKVHGKVRQAAVAIWGDLDVDGEVNDGAVAVMGNLHVKDGAKINGPVVAVGGKVDLSPGATVREHPVSVDFPRWVKTWFVQCVLKLRPLAPQVGWVWLVAGIIFLVYLFIAAVFPKPVSACVAELTRRPATTFLVGLLAKLLFPVIVLILAATGIGVVVVPFLGAAFVLGLLVGKVALLEWVGFQIGRHFGGQGLQNALIALVIGAVMLTIFYIVPVLGLLVFAITSVWGLGVAVTASFGGLRKELPEKPSSPPGPRFAAPAAEPGVGTGPSPVYETSAAAAASGGSYAEMSGGGVATASMPELPPVLPETLSYPRAGFWERMGAGFLDIILVSILAHLVHFPPLGFLLALAYFAGMWAWKGTTIGGVVLGLKVVRADGEPVTFLVALVRALAAAFSLVVLFLGFLWIAWDDEKQGWHDKIAGSLVLKLPRGTPLV